MWYEKLKKRWSMRVEVVIYVRGLERLTEKGHWIKTRGVEQACLGEAGERAGLLCVERGGQQEKVEGGKSFLSLSDERGSVRLFRTLTNHSENFSFSLWEWWEPRWGLVWTSTWSVSLYKQITLSAMQMCWSGTMLPEMAGLVQEGSNRAGKLWSGSGSFQGIQKDLLKVCKWSTEKIQQWRPCIWLEQLKDVVAIN